MRRYIGLVTAVLVVSLSVGVTTATAGGGNSANAKACQKGGWQNLVQADQTAFNNQDECVSYGAHGGTLLAAADRAYCAPSGPPTFGQCFYPGILDLDYAASSGPLGQTPSGNFLFESLPSHWGGNVTCLQVSGNVASIGGVITDSNIGFAPVGSGYSFTVTDNAPDTMSLGTFSASPPTADTPNCGDSDPSFTFELFGFSMTGDTVVKDG